MTRTISGVTLLISLHFFFAAIPQAKASPAESCRPAGTDDKAATDGYSRSQAGFPFQEGGYKTFYRIDGAMAPDIRADLPFLLSTRWELAKRKSETVLSETLRRGDGGLAVERSVQSGESLVSRSLLPLEADGAFQPPRSLASSGIIQMDYFYYLYGPPPDGFLSFPGSSEWLETKKIARGWIETPFRPYRVELFQETVGSNRPEAAPPAVRYRWFNPDIGTVALLSVSANGGSSPYPAQVRELLVLQKTNLAPLALQRFYADELPNAPFGSFVAAAERPAGTQISQLTPNALQDIGELLAFMVWDFFRDGATAKAVTTMVPPDGTETCYASDCGFSNPGNDFYQRLDNSSGNKSILAIDFNGSDAFFARALVMNENASGSEIKMCVDPSAGHISYPFLRFTHADGSRFYMQVGDTWASDTADCDKGAEINALCNPGSGNTAGLSAIDSGGSFAYGQIRSEVVADGVVTLPSGHHFDSMVIRSYMSFQAYVLLLGNCVAPVPDGLINTYTVQWMVPHIGIVAGITSELNVPESQRDTWRTTGGSSFGVGLFPPVSIRVDSFNQSSVSISWNPGYDTSYIDGYKIYWDTDSGAPYAFNSVDNSAQVAFNGTQATVSGLQPDTTYYFTVTNLYTYTEPNSSNPPHSYESLLYPMTVTGAPSWEYPAEVQATTSCVNPAGQVGNFLKCVRAGNDVMLDWQGSPDVVPMRYNCHRTTNKAECADTPAGIGDESLVDAPVNDRKQAMDGGIVPDGSLYFYEVWPRDTCGNTYFGS